MACRLVGAKPLSESIFLQENAFENVVCQMPVILPRVLLLHAKMLEIDKAGAPYCLMQKKKLEEADDV